MVSNFIAFLVSRLVTTKLLVKLVLFASEKLVQSTKVKWDNELHAIVKDALTK